MAWTAPRTWVTGEIVTAAQLNEQIRDNMNMLIQKDGSVAFIADQPMGGFSLTGLAAGAASGESARYDELHACAFSSPALALNTNYQNTTGKTIIVIAICIGTANANESYALVSAYVASSSPPGTLSSQMQSAHNLTFQANPIGWVIAIVPDDYYYKFLCTYFGTGGSTEYYRQWILH